MKTSELSIIEVEILEVVISNCSCCGWLHQPHSTCNYSTSA